MIISGWKVNNDYMIDKLNIIIYNADFRVNLAYTMEISKIKKKK